MIDTQVVSRAKQGEQKAYTEIYQETYQSAYGVAFQILKNGDDAADVLQDSYITAFTKLDTLEDNSKFQGWFNRIVANNCKNLLKKKKPTLFSELTVEEDGEELEPEFVNDNESFCPDKAVEYDETKEILRNVINSLPEEQALCIMMYYVQDLSVAEIAETLGVSQNTVKSRLNYGRKKMKTELEALEKKGVCFYGVTGLALIPFIKWMFAGGAGTQAPNVLPQVFTNVKAAKAAGTVATTASPVRATTNIATHSANAMGATKVVADVGKETVKKTVKEGIAKKVIAGIVSVALFSGGLATGAVIGNNREEPTTAAQQTVADNSMRAYLSNAMSFEGYNGYGKISDIQNFVKVEELSRALCETDEDYEVLVSSLENKGIDILDYITYDIDETKDGHLSNGDTVSVEITINYDMLNDLDGATKEIKGDKTYKIDYVVSGLKDVVVVDLFEGIEITTYNRVTNQANYALVGGEESYTKDYGPCVVTWEWINNRYWIRAHIKYTDPNGYERTISTDIGIYCSGTYVDGGTITLEATGTMANGMFEQDECLESGFVFADYTKEVVPDIVYSKLKSDSLSQASFDNLKKDVEADMESTQADTYTFIKAFAANTNYAEGSEIVFVYKNNRTGEIACWRYVDCYVDQNGNVFDIENKTIRERDMKISGVDSSSSFEKIKQAYEDYLNVVAVILSNK